jgi:hypothetical protein
MPAEDGETNISSQQTAGASRCCAISWGLALHIRNATHGLEKSQMKDPAPSRHFSRKPAL